MWRSTALILIMSLLVCTQIIQAHDATRFEPTSCDFPAVGGYTIDCGLLHVPENYDAPDGRMIALAIAILRHPSGQPLPDPIIYLEGGPGGSVLETLTGTFRSRYEALFAAKRDIILFDQRGVGFSQPALDCEAYRSLTVALLDLRHDNRLISQADAGQLRVEAIIACMREWMQQADLSQYNSAISAHDIETLRITLGYEQINLWGISYGTRLALTAMRDYPDAIRSVVLDSVYPLDVNLFQDAPHNWIRALELLFETCAAEPACSASFPDLRTVLLDTIDQLNANPVRIDVYDSISGKLVQDVTFDGTVFLDVLIQLFYDNTMIGRLPEWIYGVSAGDVQFIRTGIRRRLSQRTVISDGLYLAIQCQEELSFAERRSIYDAYAVYPLLQTYLHNGPDVERIFTMCAAVTGRPLAIANDAVYSSIPALIAAGRFDPITPPEWAQRVSHRLSDSIYIEFPDSSHGRTALPGCPQEIVVAFFLDPSTAPDTSCLDTMQLQFQGVEHLTDSADSM